MAKMVFTLAFSVHTGINIWTNISKDQMRIGGKSVKLSAIPFPVIFDISVSPGINQVELNKMCFDNQQNYFLGLNEFNDIAFGWYGHYENGTVLKIHQV